jgi:hypothetical protein
LKTIADLWAKKLGEEIGIEGKELNKIKVLSRDANSIKCQLPSNLGTKSSASFSLPLPSFLRSSASTNSSLGDSLFDSKNQLSAERNQNLEERKNRGNFGITNLAKDDTNNNFLVTADATKLIETLPQMSPAAPSHFSSQLRFEKIYPNSSETPSSVVTVFNPTQLSALKEAGGDVDVTKKTGR